jgi:hypothetical protein
MTKPSPLFAVAAATLFTLAACGQSEPDVVGGAAPDATSIAAKNKAPVELPPAIASSKTFRCKDKSVVYVNFLTDGLTANVRDKEEEPPAVTLKAPAAGEPFVGVPPTGDGFKLVGSGDEVTYTSPDSGTQVCKA